MKIFTNKGFIFVPQDTTLVDLIHEVEDGLGLGRLDLTGVNLRDYHEWLTESGYSEKRSMPFGDY
ncbi:MAG: hypothetical protein Q7J27_12375 [Syntrophales bacterium]|nr:hypothetical protein [Syntrophales bacterium]